MTIFITLLYLSWVIVEQIAKEYKINERNRIKLIGITTITSLIIAVSCSGEKKNNVKEVSFAEQMNIKYAHVAAHNDSLSALFREMEDTAVDLDSVLNSPYVHIHDSSKIIAIKYPDDQFTDFEEAFKKARFDLGPDKYFIWRNKFYSTNYKEEGYPPKVFQLEK